VAFTDEIGGGYLAVSDDRLRGIVFATTAAKKQPTTTPYMASDLGKCQCCSKATMFLKARFSNIVSGN
jgi:hypothetical protein